MHATDSYDYAIIRIVPFVERGECINVGVILFCRTRRFLGILTHLDQQRLSAFAPQLDIVALQRQLEHLVQLCNGQGESSPLGQLSPSERFHWLVAPRSTIIQVSPVHSGFSSDPHATLHHLLKTLVL